MQIGIEVISRLAEKGIKGAIKAYKDKQKVLKRIGVWYLAQVFQTFRKEGARDGHEKWAELRPSTILARRNKKKGSIKILQDNGFLRESFNQEVKGSEVRIGTIVDYAIYHQWGTRKMAQREMLFLTKGDEEHIKEIMKNYIAQEAFSGAT